jgi:hypothetical protein
MCARAAAEGSIAARQSLWLRRDRRTPARPRVRAEGGRCDATIPSIAVATSAERRAYAGTRGRVSCLGRLARGFGSIQAQRASQVRERCVCHGADTTQGARTDAALGDDDDAGPAGCARSVLLAALGSLVTLRLHEVRHRPAKCCAPGQAARRPSSSCVAPAPTPGTGSGGCGHTAAATSTRPRYADVYALPWC